MSGFQAALSKLGANTERVVGQLAERYLSGELPLDTFADMAASLITRSNAYGYQLAEQRLAIQIAQAVGRAPGAVAGGVPLAPEAADAKRIADALRVAVADPETALMRAGRVANSEPIRTAQAALSRAMATRPEVVGYQRETEGDACELCEWLYAEGRVYRTDQPMHAHAGCQCVQSPVLATDR